jgi:hypothetical protein
MRATTSKAFENGVLSGSDTRVEQDAAAFNGKKRAAVERFQL